MQQPELGQRLTALRKQQQLTQEELSEKSHVSVRTIQRIEAGEVLPRMSTIKILITALGHTLESFMPKQTEPIMETTRISPQLPARHIVLMGAIAGAVYLIAEIILGALDIVWFMNEGVWRPFMNIIYITLTITTVVSYFLFARGFIALSSIFENTLLQIGSWMMIFVITGLAFLDIISLYLGHSEEMWFAYIPAAVITGSLTIVYGVALLRLQDGMGELSRVAGILEIIVGCALITVIFFFISYVVMIPATIIEILLLYRGYEYLSKSRSPVAA